MIHISQTLVVSLQRELARRAHITRHLPQHDVGPFTFVDALDTSSPEVAEMYREGRVKKFPACFRCGKHWSCRCKNNVLIPHQVANWFSFKKVWQICAEHPDSFFLVCEDDVAFHEGSSQTLKAFCKQFVPTRTKVLVRMCASGKEPFRRLENAHYELSDRVVMSNAAYILNGNLARTLIDQFDYIETTSDVWLHRIISARDDVQALTIEPLLATDLSYNPNHAQFPSCIHPKSIDTQDKVRASEHVKRVKNRQQYEQLLSSWLSNS